ncbi:MAG: hypothetical protein ACHQ2Y_01880 [Candidatus Lutacidiplasmatales archaeon]
MQASSVRELGLSGKRRSRWGAGAMAASGVFVVVAVMAMAPASFGAATHAITIKAPYKKATLGTWNTNGQVACGTDKNVVLTKFSKLTGKGGFSELSKAPTCKGLPANTANRGMATGEFAIVFPLSSIGGLRTIFSNWTFNVAGTDSYHAGKCATNVLASYAFCQAFGESYVSASGYLIDQTNGSYFFPNNPWPGVFNDTYNETVCSYANCTYYQTPTASNSFSSSTTWSFNFTQTMNASDQYTLEFDISGGTWAEADAYNGVLTGASASASLNFDTLGNGATLNYVVIQ